MTWEVEDEEKLFFYLENFCRPAFYPRRFFLAFFSACIRRRSRCSIFSCFFRRCRGASGKLEGIYSAFLWRLLANLFTIPPHSVPFNPRLSLESVKQTNDSR